MSKLNPCPICFGNAEVLKSLYIDSVVRHYVGCKSCAMMTGESATVSDARATWNALVSLKHDDDPAQALKDLLYFIYTYQGERSYITAPRYRGALLRVICHKLVDGEWHEVSNEKLFVSEPDWSNNTGAIPASGAAVIYSALARAKQKLKEIENESI